MPAVARRSTPNGYCAATRRRRPGVAGPLRRLPRADITALLKGVRKRAPVLANRVRAAISKLFSWALDEGLVDQSPMGGVPRMAAEHSRDRILDDAELVRVWKAADKLDATGQAFVKLLILTAGRRGEVAGMAWSEIDLEAKTWTLQGARAKNDQPHLIPLVDEAIEILAGVPKVVAPGSQSARFALTISGYTGLTAFSALKREIDRVLVKDGGAPMARWTWHDIRRTVASGLARLRTPPHVIEALLNHKSGTIKGVGEGREPGRLRSRKESRTDLLGGPTWRRSRRGGRAPT